MLTLDRDCRVDLHELLIDYLMGGFRMNVEHRLDRREIERMAARSEKERGLELAQWTGSIAASKLEALDRAFRNRANMATDDATDGDDGDGDDDDDEGEGEEEEEEE
eukprot:5536593-Pyramimonas_sp.AAC.1